MTCRDYERGWNELIDRDRAGSVSVDAGQMTDRSVRLLDHAADCPACRQVGARYQVLRRALRAGVQSPAPPAGLADRILAEIEQTVAVSVGRVWGHVSRTHPRPSPRLSRQSRRSAGGIALSLPSLNRAMPSATGSAQRPCCIQHRTPNDHDDRLRDGSRRRAETQYGGGRCDRGDVGPGPLGIRAGRPDQPPGA